MSAVLQNVAHCYAEEKVSIAHIVGGTHAPLSSSYDQCHRVIESDNLPFIIYIPKYFIYIYYFLNDNEIFNIN